MLVAFFYFNRKLKGLATIGIEQILNKYLCVVSIEMCNITYCVSFITIFNHTVIDLQTVMEETIEVTDWKGLGSALGVPEYTLERIEEENKKALACQRQMYKAWIDSGKATWKGLCDGLRKLTVNKGGVADKIEQKFLI